MEFKIVILGSSSALPTSKRMPTSQIVLYNQMPYLIDCAEGTQMQIRKNGIALEKIKHIFISHLHGDHFYGIFGLLSTLNLLGRQQDLNIYAPEKLKEMYESILNLNDDVLKYKINFYPLSDSGKNLIFQNKNIEVYSFPLKHSKMVFGFLFNEKIKPLNIKKEIIEEYHLSIKQIVEIKNGSDLVLDNGRIIENKNITYQSPKTRSYMFCTDTLPLYNLDKYFLEPDILYHEATFGSEFEEVAKETFHSTAKQAAEVAKKLKAKKLIIGHFSSRYKNMSSLVNEAKSVFPNVFEANDGDVYEINN